MYDFLKKIPLFAGLPDEDLEKLCEKVIELHLPAGTELFAEGSPADRAYVIQEGEIEILKASGGRNVLIALRKPGEVIGEMALLEAAPRFATGIARKDSVLLEIRFTQLDELINSRPAAARAMLFTVASRLRAAELQMRESEKLAQLGTLTAGITHELNNPAAAAQRGAGQLSESLKRLQESQFQLARWRLSDEEIQFLMSLDELSKERASRPSDLDSLGRSDLENDIEAWLDDHGVEEAWELAPVLVSAGYGETELDGLASRFGGERLPVVLTWFCDSFTIYSLLAEINEGARRIAEIVKSLKSYVYLDQAPIQPVDVHESLDNTLVIMRHKIKGGVSVRRDYQPGLPRIQAYGSQLNQVWTNIIDNAIDAMGGQGELDIRTRRDGDIVVVEIEDNGPGIPEEIQTKIFSPFFTTKAVGKGSGLGLSTSYSIIQNHGGEIRLTSRPGKTVFRICLPINFEKNVSNGRPIEGLARPDDNQLKQILQEARRIAVVGISDKREQPNYSVPAYLQEQGYRIVPVNPGLESVLGEKAYPDLISIPKDEVDGPIDTVLVFRRSEFAPAIAEQAIQMGAKILWMQEGIINESAAARAREAGLDVIMDTCMRATHRRLFGK